VIAKSQPKTQNQKAGRIVTAVVNNEFPEWEGKRFKSGFEIPKDKLAAKRAAQEDARNRRRFFRARPSGDTVVNVTMKMPDSEVAGQLLDISTGGMGVLVKSGVARNLKIPELLRLVVDLPECMMPLDLVGTVPYRRPAADLYHYGIKFNWDKTAYYYRQEAAISAFVQQCQQNRLLDGEQKHIPIEKTHQAYYCDTPLFFRSGDKFKLYKAAGKFVHEVKPVGVKIPLLYVQPEDQEIAIREVLGGLNGKLPRAIATRKLREVKAVMEEILQLAASDTQKGSLDLLSDTIEILINAYASQSEALTAMATSSFSLYTPILHTLNVTALTLRFCFLQKLARRDILRLGLSALLHDLGKIELPRELLYPSQKLSMEQFDTPLI